MSCRKTIFSLNIIVILFMLLSPVGSTLVPPHLGVVGADSSPTTSSLSSNSVGSASSEEENIDSFDVHPESLRWNTTLDDSIEDRVIDSQFEILSVQNETSGASGYEMNRGTVKTDGKFEWRMSADGSGNYSEYFRDQLGDECDFTEDIEGFTTLGAGDSLSYGDGLLSFVSGGASNSRFGFVGDAFIHDVVYDKIVFKIKANETITGGYIQLKQTALDGSSGTWKSFEINTTWYEIEFDYSEDEPFDCFVISGWSTNFVNIFVDYFELIGDYDYATHVESEVEDTWDWEDSLEYFYDDYDNISDFNDGTTEDWVAIGGETVANVDDWLQFYETSDSLGINRTGLSIDASVYSWFTFEMELGSTGGNTLDSIEVKDASSNRVYYDTTGWTGDGTFYLLSYDLSLDGDWTGTEAGLEVYFNWSASNWHRLELNFTFLYDTEFGELDDWDTSGFIDYYYVNPYGYIEFEPSNRDIGEPIQTSVGHTVDTSIFKTVVVRIKASNDTAYFDVRIQSTAVVLSSHQHIISANTFEIFIIDLTLDSDWTGDVDVLSLVMFAPDGTYWSIDYILLLGEYADSDSVIGLMDSVGTPLLNISAHFEGNNSARFEFELLDATGDLSYYWYSDWYSDLGDQFIIGKCTFDVLRSRLEITLTCENNTRIDKITFPQEFTEASGLTPPLFSNEIAPYVFVSTFTQDHSWQHVFIDWIKADYKEREWIKTIDEVVDSNVYSVGWDYLSAKTGVSDYQNVSYSLLVPYLDSVSGVMRLAADDISLTAGGDAIYMYFDVYVVDSDDGEHQLLTRIFMSNLYGVLPFKSPYISLLDGNEVAYKNIVGTTAEWDKNSKTSFSMTFREERSILSVKMRCWLNETEETDFVDFAQNITIADWADDPSSEFVIKTYLSVKAVVGTSDLIAIFEDFGLIERDIFSDIAKAIVEPVGNLLTEVFSGLFKFLAGIFKGVGDALGVVFETVGTAITGAINNIQGWLTTLAGAIDTSIGQISGWLTSLGEAIDTSIGLISGWLTTLGETITGVLDSIVGELQDLASDVATAIWTGIVDTLDFITDAIAAIATGIWDAILLIAEDLADLFVEVVDFLIALAGDILDGIWTFITEVCFWLWDALGLPDMLAVVDMFLTTIVDLITAIPDILNDIQTFVFPLFTVIIALYWFWLIFLSFAQEGFEPFAGISNMVERLLTCYNFSILGIGPLPIPIAIIFIPLTYFLIIPSGSVFAIW